MDLVVSTFVTLIRSGTETSSAFAEARYAPLGVSVREMVRGALVLALLSLFIFRAFLTDVLVETVSGAFLATRVALAANGFPR